MKRWMLWAPVLLCLAACGRTTGSGISSTPSPAPTSHQLGEGVTVPGWLITLKSLQLTLQHGSLVPSHPSAMLLVLEVAMQNTSGQRASASTSAFSCRGGDGTTYGPIAAGSSALESPVAAGAFASGQVVFEVPIRTHQFTVFYADSSGALLARWPLSVSPTQ